MERNECCLFEKKYGFTKKQKSIQMCLFAIIIIGSIPELAKTDIYEMCITNIVLNIISTIMSYLAFMGIFQEAYIAMMCSAVYVLSVYRIYLLYIVNDREAGIFMMILPLIAYCIYRWKIWWREQRYLLLSIFFVGLAGLAVWYMIPIYQTYISGEFVPKYMQQTGLTVAHLLFHFWKHGEISVRDKMTVTDSFPLGVGFVFILALFIFYVLWYSGELKAHYYMGKICAVFGSIFLILSLNFFPWNYLQKQWNIISYILNRLQSLDRLLTIGVACVTIVFGYCLVWLKKQNGNWRYYLGIICGFISITTSSMYLIDFICAHR